jgi:hypothetical protein
VQRYRAGGSPDALVRAVDLYGDQLEQELERRLSEQTAEFERLVRALERQHGYMATTQAQLRWLRRFPGWETEVPTHPVPIDCRASTGRLIPVPALLGPLHHLELDPPLFSSTNSHRRQRGPDRRGKSPVMVALAEAGLSTRQLASELDVSKTAPWSWLNDRAADRRPGPRPRDRLADP